MSLIAYESREAIGILTVNRPEALNALNEAVLTELSAKLAELSADAGLRCLVVTGSGEKAFVAGADIGSMQNLTRAEAKAFARVGNTAMNRLEAFPVPVIAAVNGFALGGGCELALACDIRLASQKAVFGLPEVTLGIMPGFGGIQRLVRAVGVGRAKELVYTAARVKAEEALQIGLVNAVYAPEELMDEALKLAGRIAANSPLGVRAAKQAANGATGLGLVEATEVEEGFFASCFETEDQRSVMAAFMEKRKPDPFVGR